MVLQFTETRFRKLEETMTASGPVPVPREPGNYDEVSMHQSMFFSDSLKDLKNLRKQLYSAAEYFELSYTNDDKKDIVVNTLKDYAIKALVNTVDHLGSVTYKVNDLLDGKVDEVSGTELRVSCIEQRLRTCKEYVDREGLSQQSLVINTPNHNKRYILPVGETMHGAVRTNSKYQSCSLEDGDEWHQFRNAIRTTIRETPPPPMASKGRSPSPLPKLTLQQPGNFSFSANTSNKNLERRSASPHRFPLLRSGSFSSKPNTPKSSRPSTPNKSRPTTPNPSLGRQQVKDNNPSFSIIILYKFIRQISVLAMRSAHIFVSIGQLYQYISDPQKSASMQIRVGKECPKESEQFPGSKSKRLLKYLLSRRKSKKDETLYTYLDEY